MKMVVVSGKGGTGKTLISSAIASLTNSEVVAVDADVDASNLPILLPGMKSYVEPFSGAKVTCVDDGCIGCTKCVDLCHFGAITMVDMTAVVNPMLCEGCGACNHGCPVKVITLKSEHTADTYINERASGDLIYAQMQPGTEGSGKLVTTLRKLGEATSVNMIIDGSPGIGCPVIASVINTDFAIVVTEPSLAGLEDMNRVLDLLERMDVPSKVIVNKFDLNNELVKLIQESLLERGVEIIGYVPFDKKVMEAVNRSMPITHMRQSIAKDAIVGIYEEKLRRFFYENCSSE